MTDSDRLSERPRATNEELRKDLKAAVGARAELGPEMEDHVLDAFLARLEERNNQQIQKAVREIRTQGSATRSHNPNFAAVVGPSLALSIPLVAIAGGTSGGLGIAAVMLCVLAVNGMYFLYELFRP